MNILETTQSKVAIPELSMRSLHNILKELGLESEAVSYKHLLNILLGKAEISVRYMSDEDKAKLRTQATKPMGNPANGAK